VNCPIAISAKITRHSNSFVISWFSFDFPRRMRKKLPKVVLGGGWASPEPSWYRARCAICEVSIDYNYMGRAQTLKPQELP